MNLLQRAKRVSLLMLRALVISSCGIFVSTASAWTTSDADTIFNSYNNAFYNANGGNAYYKNDTTGGRSGFWTQVNIIEMAEDAYDRTGSTGTRDQITALCNGFVQYNGTNWSGNTFNDDIMWACIAFSRAYQITGNTSFRDRAKANFDLVWTRAWSTALGGGLWWTTANGSKNACVNGPGAIAACYIYKMYNDSAYLTKAQQIFDWQRNTIFNQTTGAIADYINASGTIGWGSLSYNQGTFIGAGNFLYQYTGDRQYYKDAWLAAKYFRNSLCDAAGRFYINGTGSNDGAGFGGIGIRWMARFAKDQNAWAYFYPWLKYNGDLAWNVRRSDNLSWNAWNSATAVGTRYAWECFPSVTTLQVVPANNPAPTFMLVNKNSGKCADLPGGNTANGTLIQQLTYSYNDPDQNWSLVPNENGDGFLIVHAASGKVLGVVANSTATNADVELSTYTGATGQQWALVPTGSGWFKIRNINSGLILEVTSQGLSDGILLQQYTDNGVNAQRFRLQPTGDYFIKATHSGKYISILYGSGSGNGSPIVQYPWQNSAWFKWRFESSGEGTVKASSLNALTRTISAAGSASANGTLCELRDYNTANNGSQKLRIEPLSDGRFKIFFQHSSRSWDIPGGATGDNIQMEQWDYVGNPHQKFLLEHSW